MLHELEMVEARNVASLALDARKVRDRLLEKIPDADLGEPAPARGEHNLAEGIALEDALANEPEYVALRETIAALPREIRRKLLAVTRIVRGDAAILDWTDVLGEISLLPDDDVVAALLAEPDLHNLLSKGLYALGAVAPSSDVG